MCMDREHYTKLIVYQIAHANNYINIYKAARKNGDYTTASFVKKYIVDTLQCLVEVKITAKPLFTNGHAHLDEVVRKQIINLKEVLK